MVLNTGLEGAHMIITGEQSTVHVYTAKVQAAFSNVSCALET